MLLWPQGLVQDGHCNWCWQLLSILHVGFSEQPSTNEAQELLHKYKKFPHPQWLCTGAKSRYQIYRGDTILRFWCNIFEESKLMQKFHGVQNINISNKDSTDFSPSASAPNLIQLGIGVYLSIASLRSQWNTEAKVVLNSLSCPPYQASNWTNMWFTLAQGPSPRSAVQNSPGGTRQGAVDWRHVGFSVFDVLGKAVTVNDVSQSPGQITLRRMKVISTNKSLVP